jgi:hypothetical protein
VFVGALNGTDGLPAPLTLTMDMRMMRVQPEATL